jgi:hypothetical protein
MNLKTENQAAVGHGLTDSIRTSITRQLRPVRNIIKARRGSDGVAEISCFISCASIAMVNELAVELCELQDLDRIVDAVWLDHDDGSIKLLSLVQQCIEQSDRPTLTFESMADRMRGRPQGGLWLNRLSLANASKMCLKLESMLHYIIIFHDEMHKHYGAKSVSAAFTLCRGEPILAVSYIVDDAQQGHRLGDLRKAFSPWCRISVNMALPQQCRKLKPVTLMIPPFSYSTPASLRMIFCLAGRETYSLVGGPSLMEQGWMLVGPLRPKMN